jgi:hypothetical protein
MVVLKKFFILVFLLSTTIFTTANAGGCNPYEDKNLVSFYAHQGYEYFLKKNTLNPVQDESPRVISFYYIVFDSIQPKNTKWDKENKMAFAYDVDERKVYFVDEKGNLSFLNPEGTVAEGSGYAQGAEIVYYLVYGEKFYNAYDEDFYNSIDE